MTFPKVTKNDHGIRPAGKPDECFYCRSKVGEEHKPECVIVSKLVRLQLTMKIDVYVPHFWDDEMVRFHRNDGTWCADNVLRDIERDIERNKKVGTCLCPSFEAEVLGVVDSTPRVILDDGSEQDDAQAEKTP